jgi:hypothetical protein
MPVRPNNYPRRQVVPQKNDASEGLIINRATGLTYPSTYVQGNYARSRGGKNRRGANTAQLRALAGTAPAQICLSHVIDGVAQMSIEVVPPDRLKNDPVARKVCKRISRSLKHSNMDEQSTYKEFISAIITDLMVLGVSAIERKFQPLVNMSAPLDPVEAERNDILAQEVWQWAVDPIRIHQNEEWTPQSLSEPRYFDQGREGAHDKSKWTPLFLEDLYTIKQYSTTWGRPPSPFEVVYDVIQSWLGLNTFQTNTTSKARQEFLIDLGPVSNDELKAFREFWETEVEQGGQAPILGTKGNGLTVVKIGASSDEGLYLKYEEKILRLIALIFKLSPRDMNITEPDNRATAGISADASFQKAILPMATTLLDAFQSEIVDFYYPGYRLRFIDSEPRNEAEESATASDLYEKGIITLNEARIRCKQDRILTPEGDKFKAAPGAAPASSSKIGGDGESKEEDPAESNESFKAGSKTSNLIF